MHRNAFNLYQYQVKFCLLIFQNVSQCCLCFKQLQTLCFFSFFFLVFLEFCALRCCAYNKELNVFIRISQVFFSFLIIVNNQFFSFLSNFHNFRLEPDIILCSFGTKLSQNYQKDFFGKYHFSELYLLNAYYHVVEFEKSPQSRSWHVSLHNFVATIRPKLPI